MSFQKYTIHGQFGNAMLLDQQRPLGTNKLLAPVLVCELLLDVMKTL